MYAVQHGTLLWFYETRDHQIRGKTLHDEPPVDLMHAYVTVALEYTRRKHVFRLQYVLTFVYITVLQSGLAERCFPKRLLLKQRSCIWDILKMFSFHFHLNFVPNTSS